MKGIIIAAMVALASSAAAETLELTRQQAVDLALAQNESYQATLLEKERIRGQYIEARAGAFPRLTLDGSYLRTIDLQSSVISMSDDSGNTNRFTLRFGTPHNYQFGLNLYQPIYAAGKVGAAIKIARYGFAYTDERIRAARHDIAATVDAAYLGAVAAREAAQAYREAEELADANLAVVKKLYDQGQVSEYDYIRSQVQAANSRPDRIKAENNFDLAIDRLKNLLALEPGDELIIESAIAEEVIGEFDVEGLITEALASRPELGQSRQMMNIYKKVITIERGGYLPSIGLNSRLQWDSFRDEIGKTSLAGDAWNRSWNIALVLSWPLFSGGETAGRMKQARVNYNQSRYADVQLQRQVRLEVQDAAGRVREAQQRVEALGETVEQAGRGLKISQVRYESGVGTQLELLDAQMALTTARVNRITALHDLAVAVSSLRRAIGREWAPHW